MTQEEFANTSFGKGDKIIYEGKTWTLSGVNFHEKLIAVFISEHVSGAGRNDETWLRCENCQHIPAYHK